jgi:antitoxin component YwqK of YwqJK toxin-antitoxin module
MTAPTNQLDPQGRRHGVWEDYWSDGTPNFKSHYLHGKLHRVTESYWADGTLERKGHYLHGKAHGLWEWYWDGTLSFKRYYLIIK